MSLRIPGIEYPENAKRVAHANRIAAMSDEDLCEYMSDHPNLDAATAWALADIEAAKIVDHATVQIPSALATYRETVRVLAGRPRDDDVHAPDEDDDSVMRIGDRFE